jgi:hypothetical protein
MFEILRNNVPSFLREIPSASLVFFDMQAKICKLIALAQKL